MYPVQLFSNSLKQYFHFSGRASRAEWWTFAVFQILIGIVANHMDNLFFGSGGEHYVAGLAVLALFFPSLTLDFRRLHDVGRSAWWLLLLSLPIIGWIVVLYWLLFRRGDERDNVYGPPPM